KVDSPLPISRELPASQSRFHSASSLLPNSTYLRQDKGAKRYGREVKSLELVSMRSPDLLFNKSSWSLSSTITDPVINVDSDESVLLDLAPPSLMLEPIQCDSPPRLHLSGRQSNSDLKLLADINEGHQTPPTP